MPRLIPVVLVLLALTPFVGWAAEEPEPDAKPEAEAEAKPEAKPEAEAEAEAKPEAKKLPESDPAAIALLDKAIAHQAPAEFAGAGSISDLFVRIQAEVWDYRGKEPKKQSVNVSRYLTKKPRRFRSEWRTSAGVLVNGNDGRFFWFADFDATGARKQAHLLTGNRYEKDRQRIEDERAETEYLIRFFFLGNLVGDAVVFTKKADVKIDAYGEKECFVLHRVNHAEKSTEPPLTLYFEKANHELVRAVAHARLKGDRTLRFTFLNDADVQPRVKGVLFPLKLELHEKSDKIKEYRISSRAVLEEKGIDFNSDLDAKLFVAPIVKEKPADGKDAEKK